MFSWKVEDMVLRTERPKTQDPRDRLIMGFPEMYSVNREDKIEFLDKVLDGKVSYLLDLAAKLKEKAPSMAKNQWGDIRTQSLVAWLKKNDDRKLVDQKWHHGRVNVLGSERYITYFFETKGPWDRYDDFVDEIFYRQLQDYLRQEDAYFDAHDEYTVLKSRVREYSEKYGTTFGLRIGWSSNGSVFIVNEEDGKSHGFNGPDITKEQCNILIKLYEELENKITELTNVCSTTFPK